MKSNLAVVIVGVIAAAAGISQRYAGTVVEAQTPAPSFAETVYPVLQKANCRSCHSDEGVASGTRLHFPRTPPAETSSVCPDARRLIDRPPIRSLFSTSRPSRAHVVVESHLVAEARFACGAAPCVVSDAAVSAARARLDIVNPAVSPTSGFSSDPQS